MFQEFTGREYLKIDIANNYGLDQESWDQRIAWFDVNEYQLDALVGKADQPALFYAGVEAWKKVKAGKPSGYPISLDATASGIQILAVLACDRQAAALCNVIDTGDREDAYSTIYYAMVQKLGDSAKIDRKQTKNAIMTAFYTSTAVPKRVFGEGKLLETFYDTIKEHAPGAWEITETMLAIWDPTTYQNAWVMPDNFHVKIKVMGQVNETVHFLNEPFEVTYNVNMPIEGGRSLPANTTHSIDGMIVREMRRRCNFNPDRINTLVRIASQHPNLHGSNRMNEQGKLTDLLWGHYLETGFLSARILDYLNTDNFGIVAPNVIMRLIDSLPAKPFEILTVHDCFRCLPNYGNDLRRQYNNLLAEIAESDLLANLVSQITGQKIQVDKLDVTLSDDIRQANYALS